MLRQAVCAAGVCGVAPANAHFLDMPFYRTGAPRASAQPRPAAAARGSRSRGWRGGARCGGRAAVPRAGGAPAGRARGTASLSPEDRPRNNRTSHCPHFTRLHMATTRQARRPVSLVASGPGRRAGGRDGGGRAGTVEKRPLGDADVALVAGLLRRLRPRQLYAAGDLSDPHGTHRTCLQARARPRRTA
jgi:hypothetical protein